MWCSVGHEWHSGPLCDAMDCRLPGCSVHEISQARILEWLPFPSPGNLPDAAIEPVFPASLTLAGRFFTTETPGKPLVTHIYESILQRKHQTQVMESKKMFFQNQEVAYYTN